MQLYSIVYVFFFLDDFKKKSIDTGKRSVKNMNRYILREKILHNILFKTMFFGSKTGSPNFMLTRSLYFVVFSKDSIQNIKIVSKPKSTYLFLYINILENTSFQFRFFNNILTYKSFQNI